MRMDTTFSLEAAKQEKQYQSTEALLEWYKSWAEQMAESVVELRQSVADCKRTEETLRQSEALFRATFEQAAVGIAHVAPDGRWLRVNRRLCDILGYTTEELLSKSFQDVTHPDDLIVDLQSVAQVLSGEIQTYAMHKRYLHKYGSIIWANLTVSLVRDGTGAPAYFVSVVEDITQLKQAEQALQQSEERYRRVVEDQIDLICRFGPDFKLTFVNQPYSEAFGKCPDEMIGKSILDVIPLEYHARVIAHLAALNPTRRVATCDNPILLANGALRWFQWTDQLIVDDMGQVVEYQGVGRDITERKRAEETLQQAFEKEKELSELKSRFVSMASHEFRTPLATIFLLTETLLAYRHKLTDDQIVWRLGKIQAQVGYLKDIMEDVLQLARIQARRAEFKPVRLDLDALCRNIIEEFQSQPDINHRLLYICNTTLPEVCLDKRLMRQIISNLVSNAIKYSDQAKSVVINLACTGKAFVLQVRDEGIGIPEADLKHLFEPFHRAANVGTISGTGLGLVITKESVELHGGAIIVKSQIGVGTTFTVTIPLVASEEREHDQTSIRMSK